MTDYKIHMLRLTQCKNEKPKCKLCGILIAHMISPLCIILENVFFFVSNNMRYKERSRNIVVSRKKKNRIINNTDRIAAALCADGQGLKTIVQKGKVSGRAIGSELTHFSF